MKAKTTQKGQGFVQGALILMFANVVVKLIGALFKLPLTNMIGEQAMGYFSSAYSIFTTFFIISTAGLPVAMSRMVAAAHARGDEAEVRQIFSVGMRVFLVLGTVGTAI
ncbi:MAG: oligosaccharide flippase family protein, partial [Clostridia bacterium]|nr:oligosaccharide flippase family protein [Clostridia bacterium]